MGEDFENMAPMQRSLESPAFRGIPLNYQERRIWHFNEQLDRMIGVDRIPPTSASEQLLAPTWVTDRRRFSHDPDRHRWRRIIQWPSVAL